jgi:hypothetical protein
VSPFSTSPQNDLRKTVHLQKRMECV